MSISRLFTVFVVAALSVVTAAGLATSSAAPEVQAADRVTPVQITFTKWFSPGFPDMVGFVGGDVTGSFAGTVLSLSTSADDRFYDLTAQYEIIADNPSQSFTALISGRQDISRGTAVLDGVVTDGWLTGEPVHVTFQVISCTQAPDGVCFQGTIRIP